VNADAISWTHGLALCCEPCGWSGPPALLWDGCERCGGPLQTTYAGDQRLPIAAAARTDLGLRTTPLVLSRSTAATYLKLESANPTGSHKDRFHAVTSALARLAGARGVVTTSTGNHGVSCAAHAARDGLAFRRLVAVAESRNEIDVLFAGALGGLNHGAHAGAIDRHRLFAKDVLAGLNCCLQMHRPKAGGRGQEDDIDAIDDILVRVETGRTPIGRDIDFLGEFVAQIALDCGEALFDLVRKRIGHGDELDIGIRGQGVLGGGGAAPAAADQTYAERVATGGMCRQLTGRGQGCRGCD
jgi:hypothetical protein